MGVDGGRGPDHIDGQCPASSRIFGVDRQCIGYQDRQRREHGVHARFLAVVEQQRMERGQQRNEDAGDPAARQSLSHSREQRHRQRAEEDRRETQAPFAPAGQPAPERR